MEKLDTLLPALERVVNIPDGPDFNIYAFSDVIKKKTTSVPDAREIKDSKDIGSATVFNVQLNDQKLTFYKENDRFNDEQTRSEWDITEK